MYNKEKDKIINSSFKVDASGRVSILKLLIIGLAIYGFVRLFV